MNRVWPRPEMIWFILWHRVMFATMVQVVTFSAGMLVGMDLYGGEPTRYQWSGLLMLAGVGLYMAIRARAWDIRWM